MQISSTTALYKLGDSDKTLARDAEDIRGRKVVDIDEEEIGKVHDLYIDEQQDKVRFIEVSSGGFLGLGTMTFLLPVDVIRRIDSQNVHIDRTRQHIAESPSYDPEIVDLGYFENIYNYYGYQPYWTPGYIYPGYPYFV